MAFTKKAIKDAFAKCNTMDELNASYKDMMKRQDDAFKAGDMTSARLTSLDGFLVDLFAEREDEILEAQTT